MRVGLLLGACLAFLVVQNGGCVSNPTPHPAADTGGNAAPDPDGTDLMAGNGGCDVVGGDADVVVGGDAATCGDGDVSDASGGDVGPDDSGGGGADE